MVIRKPYLWAVAVIVIIILVSTTLRHHSPDASLQASGNVILVSSSAPITVNSAVGNIVPVVLSSNDEALYEAIFAAQKKTDWKKADGFIAKLTNPLLMGYVLADRYTNRHYESSAAELTAWLSNYADHPQAYDIYTLATNKSIKGVSPIHKQASLQGYGDDNSAAAGTSNNAQANIWHKALVAWKKGEKREAGRLFSSLLADDHLPEWKASAAAFWSYRCFDALGNHNEAKKYLRLAAEEPRSFYGILARQKLGQSLELDTSAHNLEESDILEMVGDNGIRRVIALTQVGHDELAERELRFLFPKAEREEKQRLLALAHELNLPSVQIAMARQLGNDDHKLDYARYPIPEWQPHNGFIVDRALVYAMVRQESGFHASAVSPDGALGLMQLMPKTASLMKRMHSEYADTTLINFNASDPMYNMALGQDYIRHLLDNDLVEGNLLYLLVAYNAGPGRLMEWKNSIAYNNDPLLFIESIPYTETRNYVKQVMVNYWIYSELVGNPNPSIIALLSGEWPDYNKRVTQTVMGKLKAIVNKTG